MAGKRTEICLFFVCLFPISQDRLQISLKYDITLHRSAAH